MNDAPDAVIVPQGKVLDFIDGSLRSETPEEYVRQEIEKSLIREYRYDREEIEVEFRVAVGSPPKKAVDLAIFPTSASHEQERIWAICECKAESIPPDHRKEGVDQLKSYMAACVNAEYGMWTNGRDRFCYQKVRSDHGFSFLDIPDIPIKGKSPDERPTPAMLRQAGSDALLFAFRRCHDYIAGNQGLQKPEAFWELLKVIFCKIEDERAGSLQFYATATEWQALNGQLKVRDRLARLFSVVCKKYPTIFKANDVIELEPRVLAFIVSQLQGYSLLESGIDVKGKAYEEIVGANLRGDRGEFFTPRNICRMAVRMLDPGPDDLILDPACGTSGFLTIAMNHVLDKIRLSEQARWRTETPSESELGEFIRKRNEYMARNIVGIDLNPNLVRASKMNMVMNNDGSGGLFQSNSLERPAKWAPELRDRSLLGSADLVFTNPPFGSKIPITDPAILEQYELAHLWAYDKAADRYYLRQPRTLAKSVPPEILFVERCVQFLKPGRGRVAIVLPDGILGAPGLGYVRDWILRNTVVLASIDLHPDTFQPKNSTQTSLLVLQRKSQERIRLEQAAGVLHDYQVFMALANHVGHDKRGNRTYIRDADGNEVVNIRTERRRETQRGVVIYREIETREKVEDDSTEQIAERFREWLRRQT